MRIPLALPASILLYFCHFRVTALSTITKGPWMTRVSQLLEFKKQHGHVRVPKRYKDDPGLGNWVNKQRQQYRHYITGQKPCSLTKKKIEQLEQLGFSWNGNLSDDQRDNHDTNEGSSDDSDWWGHFRELQNYVSSVTKQSFEPSSPGVSLSTLIPRQSRLGYWLRKQRAAKLSMGQLTALDQLDPHWKLTFREFVWEQRYQELQSYRVDHGDCCVSINYSQNRPLAHWVSNQRKLYNKNLLPPDRLQKLNAIGFVWDRWEHEFEKKAGKWEDHSTFE